MTELPPEEEPTLIEERPRHRKRNIALGACGLVLVLIIIGIVTGGGTKTVVTPSTAVSATSPPSVAPASTPPRMRSPTPLPGALQR